MSNSPEENKNVRPVDIVEDAAKAYGGGDEGRKELEYSLSQIQKINDALELRERNSIVFNGVSYSRAYVYNQRKAINYAPPRNPRDDREVSMGIIHEKIISFVAIFLKYMFRRKIKCYGKDGELIPGLGEVYDLSIEFSQRMEQFVKKVALIYWEVFTQGNAFVLEDWDVRTITRPVAYKKGENGEKIEVTADTMDYTYEFLENLTYENGEEFQTRKAVSKVLDGRMVIFDNPEVNEVQDQTGVTFEEELTRADAEQLYGTLERWKDVPSQRTQIDLITPEKITLFQEVRLTKPESTVIIHRRLDKINNRMNIWINGLMMLKRDTPMSIFYPRMNYPLTNVPAERLTGSIYARSIPAKTKFNADYLDWILKQLALKFEQGIVPAILAKGKYTLSRNIFRAGEVTHGVTKADYEKADPDNNGVTNAEFSFANLFKEILEGQTLNPTATGELSPNSTATDISLTYQNQRDKLAYILDGLMNGFMDMALRRAETIESKYTIKQKETVVDGKTISVYQNFNINMSGVNHSVIFDDTIGTPDYGVDSKRNELFKKAFQSKKNGQPSEYYLADPIAIRKGEYNLDIEIVPERIKDTDIKIQSLWGEFTQLMALFGQNVNQEELKKIYLEESGRPSSIFNSADMMKLKQIQDTATVSAQANGPTATPQAKPSMLPNNPKAASGPALLK